MEEPVVLGLPRGGVPVAAHVAVALHAPLDVLIVRKLGVPTHPEVAMGAIGEGDVRILDQRLITSMGIRPDDVAAVERRERAVVAARAAQLRKNRKPLDLTGRTALIVDDGIATGATASAACDVARALGATRIIVAAPVGAQDAARLVHGADDVICLLQPRHFRAVGAHYLEFEPTSDAEVVAILEEAHRHEQSDAQQ